MNREILFRGKRVDNGEWVEGYYVKCFRASILKHYIYEGIWETYGNKYVEVIEETVGQYTGLKDKQGKKIFEDDIVRFIFDINIIDDYLWLSLTDKQKKDGYILTHIEIPEIYTYSLPDEIEVIGNIFEHPELLQEGKNDTYA